MQLNIELRINLEEMKKIGLKEKLQIDDYTRLEKEETLIEYEFIFFANQLIWGETILGSDC